MSQKHFDDDLDAADNAEPMEIDDEERTSSAQELIANMVEGVSAEALHLLPSLSSPGHIDTDVPTSNAGATSARSAM